MQKKIQKHVNLKTGLMKYLLFVLPNTDRNHDPGTFEVIFGLSSVFIKKKR